MAVILLMIVIISVTVTAVLTGTLNTTNSDKNRNTISALEEAREQLIAYSLQQTPPGTLPCPDSTGDGLENLSVSACQSQSGYLPYRTIGMPRTADGDGIDLWYAVDVVLTANASGNRNSSTTSSFTVNGNASVAVLIAAGAALNSQTRATIARAEFLEDINADGSTGTYVQATGETNNDILLGVDRADFWTLVEGRVLPEVSNLLEDYRSACGEYPWAAAYRTSPYNSTASLRYGSLPLNQALPTDWNSGCASGISPPAWLTTHWADQLYYNMCLAAEGDCLSVNGAPDADAVVIAPGVALTGQSRLIGSQGDFFEDNNAVNRATCP